jgi:hypothetical protein
VVGCDNLFAVWTHDLPGLADSEKLNVNVFNAFLPSLPRTRAPSHAIDIVTRKWIDNTRTVRGAFVEYILALQVNLAFTAGLFARTDWFVLENVARQRLQLQDLPLAAETTSELETGVDKHLPNCSCGLGRNKTCGMHTQLQLHASPRRPGARGPARAAAEDTYVPKYAKSSSTITSV